MEITDAVEFILQNPTINTEFERSILEIDNKNFMSRWIQEGKIFICYKVGLVDKNTSGLWFCEKVDFAVYTETTKFIGYFIFSTTFLLTEKIPRKPSTKFITELRMSSILDFGKNKIFENRFISLQNLVEYKIFPITYTSNIISYSQFTISGILEMIFGYEKTMKLRRNKIDLSPRTKDSNATIIIFEKFITTFLKWNVRHKYDTYSTYIVQTQQYNFAGRLDNDYCIMFDWFPAENVVKNYYLVNKGVPMNIHDDPEDLSPISGLDMYCNKKIEQLFLEKQLVL